MIDQSQSLTIIADHSKFGRIASFKVCDLEQIKNLVCDQMPPEKIKSVLLKSKVNIISVTP
jgi:DeoR family glycerol-3-phosphate regulon repressor